MQKSILLYVCIFILAVSGLAQADFNPKWFVPNDDFSKTITVSKNITAEIKTPKGELQVTIGGATQKFFKVETLFDDKMFVEAADFNADGYADLNIFYAYGYMGVNQYSKIFLFDAKTKRFNFAIAGSTLVWNPQTQILTGYEKSGASGTASVYKVNSGALYLFETARWVGECLQEIQRFAVTGQLLTTTMSNPCSDTPANVNNH